MTRISKTIVTTETAVFARDLIAKLGGEPVTLGNATTGESAHLPPHIADLLREVLLNLAAGRPITLTQTVDEMTPNEAADFLNVSRPYVMKLLDDGVLPYREVGTHRRIPFADLAAYKDQERAKSRRAMRELSEISQELGLYEVDDESRR